MGSRLKIRKEAKQTLEYFKEQNVSVKIISGDNVHTVCNIAKSLKNHGVSLEISSVLY